MASVGTIIEQLKIIRPGERVIYYVGCMASGRSSIGNAETAALAMILWERRRAHLVQRRLGPPVLWGSNIDWSAGQGPGFEYIAIGMSAPRKGVTFNAHLKTVMEAV